jgi:hypothetical protein
VCEICTSTTIRQSFSFTKSLCPVPRLFSGASRPTCYYALNASPRRPKAPTPKPRANHNASPATSLRLCIPKQASVASLSLGCIYEWLHAKTCQLCAHLSAPWASPSLHPAPFRARTAGTYEMRLDREASVQLLTRRLFIANRMLHGGDVCCHYTIVFAPQQVRVCRHVHHTRLHSSSSSSSSSSSYSRRTSYITQRTTQPDSALVPSLDEHSPLSLSRRWLRGTYRCPSEQLPAQNFKMKMFRGRLPHRARSDAWLQRGRERCRR